MNKFENRAIWGESSGEYLREILETGRRRETERFLYVRGASVSTGFIFAPRKGQGPLLPLPCIPANSPLPPRRPFSLLSIRIPSIGIVDVSSVGGEAPGGCYEEPSGLIPALQENLRHNSVLKVLWSQYVDNTTISCKGDIYLWNISLLIILKQLRV